MAMIWPGCVSFAQRRKSVFTSMGLEEWVPQFDRNRWGRSLILFLPVVILVSAAWAGPSPSSQPAGRIGRAVDRTLQEGRHATLPPHLSTLLGISAEKGSPVMQGVIRSDKVVRGF